MTNVQNKIWTVCNLFAGVALTVAMALSLVIAWMSGRHGKSGAAGCIVGSVGECSELLSSGYSYLAGVHVAWIATSFYLLVGCVYLLWLVFRSPVLKALLAGAAFVALGISVRYLQLMFELDGFCILCLGIHAANAILIVSLLINWGTEWRWARKPHGGAGRRWIWAAVAAPISYFLLFLMQDADARFLEPTEVERPVRINEIEGTSPRRAELDAKSRPGEIVDRQPLVIHDDGDVEVKVFIDLTCDQCRKLARMLETIHDTHPGRLRIVIRFFPFDTKCNPGVGDDHELHAHACEVAELAYAVAHESDAKFREWHAELIQREELRYEDATHLATRLTDRTSEELASSSIATERWVDQDVNLGIDYGIEAIPTMIVNGRRYEGCPERIESLTKVLFAEP